MMMSEGYRETQEEDKDQTCMPKDPCDKRCKEKVAQEQNAQEFLEFAHSSVESFISTKIQTR